MLGCKLPEDLSPGLKGQDQNANGIRDDIDQVIATEYSSTPELKKAAEMEAQGLQAFMQATTPKDAYVAANKLGISTECLFRALPGRANYERRHELSNRLEALTANTKERFEKYWASNGLISGATFSLPKEVVCD